MQIRSDSLAQAASDVAAWVKALIGQPVRAVAPGLAATAAEVALAPLGLDEGRADRKDGITLLRATGHFCLSFGPKAPEQGCAWLDRVYFAALTSDAVALSPRRPDTDYWQTPPGLFLTLARRIERSDAGPRPARVEHPLVFDILPDTARPTRERT